MRTDIQAKSSVTPFYPQCLKALIMSVFIVFHLSACSVTPTASSERTLYEELGGETGVEQLTNDFIREIAADQRIKGRYRNSDIGRFHRMMVEQMCMETGGGCTYTGDDMQQTHAGMKITRVEFNAIVEALMRAMDSNDIDQGVQNRLLAIYAPMHQDIVLH